MSTFGCTCVYVRLHKYVLVYIIHKLHAERHVTWKVETVCPYSRKIEPVIHYKETEVVNVNFYNYEFMSSEKQIKNGIFVQGLYLGCLFCRIKSEVGNTLLYVHIIFRLRVILFSLAYIIKILISSQPSSWQNNQAAGILLCRALTFYF